MMACFYCVGTVDVDREMANTLAIDLVNTGAPSLKNHAGSLSSSVAVCRSVSRALNTVHSVNYRSSPSTVCLRPGARYLLSVEIRA